MSINDHLSKALEANLGLLKMTLADMTDAELLVRPVPAANNGAWQIGHLAESEISMMRGLGIKMPELPVGFADTYDQKGAKIDDPAKFVAKAKVMELFEKARGATIAWVKTATPTQLAAPSPEQMRPYAPTAVDLVQMSMSHVAMHLGQIQVLRRKLGKPILF